ncbi:MAG: MFS transporter [Nostoc sp.]|uniref:MFS transporter n=1 Tax=Nostoc sp. TaxID=1180 RepID=UPI002FF4734C
MSACIIVAHLVMIPVSNLAGRFAHTARKPIFLLGFAVLPVRGVLYTLSDNPYFLVSVQILDGIGAGIFGVLSVLMVTDLTKSTGPFNVTQGMLNTAIGVGTGLSNVLAGFVVQSAGYNVGFLILAAMPAPGYAYAVVALGVFLFCVPETKTGVKHLAKP